MILTSKTKTMFLYQQRRSLILSLVLFLGCFVTNISSSDWESHRFLRSREKDDEHSSYGSKHNLRVLSFGTSRTWGSGMKDPQKESFPGLLNPYNNKNLALRASDANYPAMCTYTLVGNYSFPYDIITIEYEPMSASATEHAMTFLAKRLRQRYPDAIIILVNVWTLHQFFHLPSSKSLRRYVLDNTDMMKPGNPTIPQGALKQVLGKTKASDWKFEDFNSNFIMSRVAQAVDAVVLTLEAPVMTDPIAAMLNVEQMYLTDMSHFSTVGHEWIRDRIVDVVKHKGRTRPIEHIEPWEDTDMCVSWFENGDGIEKVSDAKLQSNMGMRVFSTPMGRRYSLEALPSREFNYIEVANPTSKPQHLYLSHMGSGPNRFYPFDTIAHIHPNLESLQKQIEMTAGRVVPTWFPDISKESPMHSVHHRYIGTIPPGVSFLNLKAKDPTRVDNDVNISPFRTVGLLITPAAFVDKVEALY